MATPTPSSEEISKNCPGGLKGSNTKPRLLHLTAYNPTRLQEVLCFIDDVPRDVLVIAPSQPMTVGVVTRAMSKLQILATEETEKAEKDRILQLAESVEENEQEIELLGKVVKGL